MGTNRFGMFGPGFDAIDPFGFSNPFGSLGASSPLTRKTTVIKYERFTPQETPSSVIESLMLALDGYEETQRLVKDIFRKDRPEPRQIKYTVLSFTIRVDIFFCGTLFHTDNMELNYLMVKPRHTNWRTWASGRYKGHPKGTTTQD